MDTQQRAEVISQARKIILELGVKSFRMDDLAHTTHTSKRTLYEEFGDKEELLFQAVKQHFDEFFKENARKAKLGDNVLESILIIMGEIRKNSQVNWQLRNSLLKFYPNILQRINTDKAEIRYKAVVTTIKIGQKQGLIRKDINIELTISILNYISIGITHNNDMITIPEGLSSDQTFEEVLIYILRGISTENGIVIIDKYNNQ